MTDATANADQDRLQAFAAALAANPSAAAFIRRLVTPGAEEIVVHLYTSRDGARVLRACRKGDMAAYVDEASWSSNFFREHPCSSAVTFGEVINRKELAKDAWNGRNDDLRRAVDRRLDDAASPRSWQFFWPVIERMAVNDLMPFLQITPPPRAVVPTRPS